MGLLEYLLATRPWGFSCSIPPIIITAILLHIFNGVPLFDRKFFHALVFFALMHVIGGLLNSIYDFKSGVDDKDTYSDRIFVDKRITFRGAYISIVIYAAIAAWIIWPNLVNFEVVYYALYLSAIFLGAAYTVPPMNLKHRAMGDVLMFFCFGPALAYGTSVFITGESNFWVLPYSFPISILTCAVLHANNTRDMKADARVGITLAMLLGFDRSRKLYIAIIATSYLLSLWICVKFTGAYIVLTSLPLALKTIRSFTPQTMFDMDRKTARLQLVFSVLLITGIYVSPAHNDM